MPGDVMIVGEPSLMGGEMDDEDERFITRLENNQYDPNVYQQNSKQQFLNSNQMKREHISYPPSPQQQLPSMFSNNPSTQTNGELLTKGKRISTNSPQTPSVNNQNSSIPAPNTPTNSILAEKKQEPHTPPITPQQTIATAS